MGLFVQGDLTSHNQKLNRFAAALNLTNAFASVTVEDPIRYDNKDSVLDIIAMRQMPIEPNDSLKRLLERDPKGYFQAVLDQDYVNELWHFEVKSGTSGQSLDRAREQLARGREHYFSQFDRIFSYIVSPHGVDLEARLLKPPYDRVRPTEEMVREAIVADAFYAMQHSFRYAA